LQATTDLQDEVDAARNRLSGTRYRSLRLVPQESQDDCDGMSSGSGRTTPGFAPVPKSQSELVKELRKKFHDTFQV
jgi:hypothetical protein